MLPENSANFFAGAAAVSNDLAVPNVNMPSVFKSACNLVFVLKKF